MSSVAQSPNRLFWLIVLAVFLPFVSTGIEFGVCSQEFWLNLVLSLLIPFCGFIHAVYVLVHARYSRTPSRSGYEPIADATDAERAAPSAGSAAVPGDAATAPAAAVTAPAAAAPGDAAAPMRSTSADRPDGLTAPLLPTQVHTEGPAGTDAAAKPPPYTPGNSAPFDNKIQRS